jgi:phosphatidylserine/phosphatidylglycerophosphate/cardiolipin synthase-like enzyme
VTNWHRFAGGLGRKLGVLACFIGLPAFAASPIEVHNSPAENLEHIDRELIASARHRIDMAAYTLTNHAVIDALRAVESRGVEVRILIDPRQAHAREEFKELTSSMHETTRNPWMHLKSYAVDGEILRTGSANFSASGEKEQDNDLVILRDRESAATFERRFEVIWRAGRPYSGAATKVVAGEPADRGHNLACDIKGNVNRKGDRLYHLPSDPAYAKVTMNSPAKKWFCSEGAAAAAGWRHAGVANR